MSENQILLTSSEIAILWTAYLNDSMTKNILGYFLKDVEDDEIRSVVQYTHDISANHLKILSEIFYYEKLPLPVGFTDEDVNMNAPRVYTDMFMLTYINHIAKAGLLAYGGFISMSARKDIRTYFRKGIQEISELYDRSTDVSLEKGLFVRAPYIAYPSSTDYVDTHKYLSGFSVINRQRPLNAIEISHLYMNIQTNLIGAKLAQSFAQASSREEIQKWMLRGRDISEKHIKVFTKSLIDNDVQPPVPSDISITNSTIAPFSDKLTMFHMSLLSAAGTGNYATAAAASQRSDLVLNYERLSLEIARYAKAGADIMIQNEWLEQPPGTVDRDLLAKKKDV